MHTIKTRTLCGHVLLVCAALLCGLRVLGVLEWEWEWGGVSNAMPPRPRKRARKGKSPEEDPPADIETDPLREDSQLPGRSPGTSSAVSPSALSDESQTAAGATANKEELVDHKHLGVVFVDPSTAPGSPWFATHVLLQEQVQLPGSAANWELVFDDDSELAAAVNDEEEVVVLEDLFKTRLLVSGTGDLVVSATDSTGLERSERLEVLRCEYQDPRTPKRSHKLQRDTRSLRKHNRDVKEQTTRVTPLH